MIKLIFLLSLLNCRNLWSYHNRFALKAAVSFGVTQTLALEDSKDDNLSIGFVTHFGYRFTNLEINLSSYVNFSDMEETNQSLDGEDYFAEGNFRSTSFAFMTKYIFDRPLYKNTWHFTIQAGPTIGLQTYKFDSDDEDGDADLVEPRDDFVTKLTYDSFGYVLAFGVEEILDKGLRPTYFELSYKYLQSRRGALASGEPHKIIARDEQTIGSDIREHSLMFSIGITFF